VIRDEQVAAGLRNEFCLRVVGEVTKRPEGNANPALPTGDVEVTASEVEVLNEAAPLPFQIDEHVEVGEEVRLRYRYLDLRRRGLRRPSGCAARSAARHARCCTGATSSRSRHRR
jgi:aspartyl-tRNA synthetase